MSTRATFLLLLASALVACDAENLSVGDVRCEGVSCAPIEVDPVDIEPLEIEHVERDERLMQVIQPSFCNLDWLRGLSEQTGSSSPLGGVPGELDPTCLGDAMVAVGEERFVIATAFNTALDSERVTAGIRLAGYAGEALQWESTELSRELTVPAGFFGDAFVIARGAAPGEAIVGVTRETGQPNAYGVHVHGVKSDGELIDLFEDENAGRVRAIAAFEEDFVIASDYEQRLELTRYTSQGDVVWRQTTLTLGEEWPSSAQTDLFFTALRVIDDQRIIVLVPRERSFQLLELNGQGELVRTWISHGQSNGDAPFFGARLTTGLDGQLVVGVDGYDVDRGSLTDAGPRIERFSKQRTQFYSPKVLGLHVDHAGYIYVATIDGIRDQGYGLIERISPDLSRRESFVLADRDAGEGVEPMVITGDLFVTEDQRTLYFALGGALGTLELPPIQ